MLKQWRTFASRVKFAWPVSWAQTSRTRGTNVRSSRRLGLYFTKSCISMQQKTRYN